MKNSIYSIGDINENFVGKKLPIVREVMSVFFYEHTFLKKTNKESSKSTVNKVKKVWDNAGIPTERSQRVSFKVIKTFNTWKILQKSFKRKKSNAQKKGSIFSKS